MPKSLRNANKDKASGRTPVPKEKLLKYSRGEAMDGTGVKKNVFKTKLARREKVIEYSTEQAARLETLLPEDSG